VSKHNLKTYRLALESIASGNESSEAMLRSRTARLEGGSKVRRCARGGSMPVDPPDPFAWARGAPLERGPRPLREGERR
jgi:hypothetical protein